MTMISRILGFVRDMVIARLFGAGSGADAFFVAFHIPNFWRRLFAEGAFSQAFVPVLSEYKTQRPHDEVRALVRDCEQHVMALVEQHRPHLDALAQALLEHETLGADEVAALLRGPGGERSAQ